MPASPASPTSPPSGAPAQRPSGGAKRAWLVVAAAAVVAVAAVTGLLLTRDDDEQAGDDTDTTDQPTETTLGTDPPDETTTTVDPFDTDILGGDLGTGSSEPLEPLPGDDWGPEAQAQFVEDCQSTAAASAAIVGGDPAALCSCTYDDLAASELSLAEFNEMWAATGDIDTTSPAAQAFQNAMLGCATGGIGG